jgi:hypothetical protein
MENKEERDNYLDNGQIGGEGLPGKERCCLSYLYCED